MLDKASQKLQISKHLQGCIAIFSNVRLFLQEILNQPFRRKVYFYCITVWNKYKRIFYENDYNFQ